MQPSLTWSSVVVVFALASLVAGCADRTPERARKQGPIPAIAEVPPERSPVPGQTPCDLEYHIGSCPQVKCGSNSPQLTSFDLGPLNLEGCRNRDGVRIVLGTLRAAAPCAGVPMRFAVTDGEIVGVLAAAGAEQTCKGPALVGATFWVEGPPWAFRELGATPAQLERIKIVRQQLQIVAVGPTPLADGGGLPLTSYAIERTGVALAIDAVTSTSPSSWYDVSSRPRTPANLREGFISRNLCALGQAERSAVVFAGEAYIELGDVELKSNPSWFHLACLGSGIAKMRLMGYDPQAGTSTRDERMATLKMLTARYCGGPLTVPGVMIVMRSRAATEALPANLDPIEARWTARGASCLSHSRLWRAGIDVPATVTAPLGDCCATEADFVAKIQHDCGIPACAPTSSATNEYWTTYTVDHVVHPTPTRPLRPVRLSPPW